MRATTTRGTINYDYDSEELGQGLYFTLEYVFEPGDAADCFAFEGRGYSGSRDDVSIVAARCTRIIDEHTDRKLDARESEDVGKWFIEQLDGNYALREAIEDRIIARERGF